MTQRNLFLAFIALAAVILASTHVAKCTRDKPVKQHTENRQQILKLDSLQSVIDTHYRARIDSLKNAYRDTIQDMKDNYKVIVQKDVRVEYRYRKAPTVVTCDSVINSKNMRIATLETINKHHHYTDLINDSLITSFQGSVRAKDETIHDLNAGYEQAIVDLAKAKKPRRFGLGLQVGYGIGPSLTPAPVVSVGLSYNIVRF